MVDVHARTWADELGGPGQQARAAAARLQDLLLETARAELDRRQDQIPAGAEPGALAREAAAAALAAVVADLGERGAAPFPIWAAKFVMAEVSANIAQLQWRAGALPAVGRESPAGFSGSAGVLDSLRRGVQQDLSEQQRIVFQAVLLGGVPVNVLALEFGSTRSAIYKSMFEARRRLADRLAADGHHADPLTGLPSDWPSSLADLLAVTPGGRRLRGHLPGGGQLRQQRTGWRRPSQGLAAVRVHLAGLRRLQAGLPGPAGGGPARAIIRLECPSGPVRYVGRMSQPSGAGHHEGGPMKYMLLICVGEDVQLTPEDGAEMERATLAWVDEMDGRGVRLQGAPLQPVSDATTVRVRQDEVLISDGPFAETKEQIGGFDILECTDLDQAIEVAAKHPVARIGTIEVRPFWLDEDGN